LLGTGSSLRAGLLPLPVLVARGEDAGVVNSPDCVSGILRGIDEGPSRLDDLCLDLGFMSGVGVLEPWKLLFLLVPTTLLAGELPGVSTKLLAIDLSLDMTVETESRSCFSRLLSEFISSRLASISRISPCKAAHLRFMSLCIRRISPLTVSLSCTPRSMMARTRSIAGP
jgi:hypothetical protein